MYVHVQIMNCFPVLHFILEKDMFYTLNNAKYNSRNSLLQNQNIFGPTLKKVTFLWKLTNILLNTNTKQVFDIKH